MNPGATMSPVASIVRAAVTRLTAASPTNAILSPVTPTSARRLGAPLPSTSVPPRMRMSTRCCAPSSAGRNTHSAAPSAEYTRVIFTRRRCRVTRRRARPCRDRSVLYSVAGLANGEDVPRLGRVVLELAPQLGDVRVDRAAVHLARVSPDLLEQLAPRRNLAAALQ